jgi:hypothetical protein
MASGDIKVVQENSEGKYDELLLVVSDTPVEGLSDSSVTYEKIASDLKSSEPVSAENIDWSSAGVFTKSISADTTFTFSNLQLNKVITIILSGDYVITWPSYMDADHLISGSYDGTTTNYIQVHCTNDAGGSEEVWWAIKTLGA